MKPWTGFDSWNSWRIAITCGFVHLFCSLSLASMGIIFTGTREDFGSERELASWPVTAIMCGMQLISPAFSVLVRIGTPHVWILRVCTLMIAVTLWLCYFARSILHLTVLLGLHGTSIAGIYVSANVMMAGHFNKERTAASGTQEMIAGTSVFFMSALMQHLVNRFRTTTALSILGCMSFISFLLAFTVSPIKVEGRDAARESTKDPEEAVEFGPSNRSEREQKPLWKILTSFTFILNVFSFWVIFECYSSFLQFNDDYSRDLGIETAAVWLVPIFGIGDMLFKLAAGFLSNAKLASPTSLMALGSLAQCVGFLGLGYSFDFKTLAISAFVLGAANGTRIFLFIIILIKDFGLESLAHTFSHANFCMGVLSLVKPFLVGLFRDRNERYLGLFVMLAVLNALVACYWIVRAARGRK